MAEKEYRLGPEDLEPSDQSPEERYVDLKRRAEEAKRVGDTESQADLAYLARQRLAQTHGEEHGDQVDVGPDQPGDTNERAT
jgi:hypothetical protein